LHYHLEVKAAIVWGDASKHQVTQAVVIDVLRVNVEHGTKLSIAW
jgi:hypothetical protein